MSDTIGSTSPSVGTTRMTPESAAATATKKAVADEESPDTDGRGTPRPARLAAALSKARRVSEVEAGQTTAGRFGPSGNLRS